MISSHDIKVLEVASSEDFIEFKFFRVVTQHSEQIQDNNLRTFQ